MFVPGLEKGSIFNIGPRLYIVDDIEPRPDLGVSLVKYRPLKAPTWWEMLKELVGL